MLIPANETIKDQLIHTRLIPEGHYVTANGDDRSTKLQSSSFANSLPPFDCRICSTVQETHSETLLPNWAG